MCVKDYVTAFENAFREANGRCKLDCLEDCEVKCSGKPIYIQHVLPQACPSACETVIPPRRVPRINCLTGSALLLGLGGGKSFSFLLYAKVVFHFPP